MRIICLIESIGSGGAERQMVGLASLLKQKGHEVALWAYYSKDFYRKTLEQNDVEYRYIEKAQSKFSRIPILRKELRNWQPDVVIAYLPTAAAVACVLRIVSGIKFKLIVSERNTSQNYDLRERVRFSLYRWADWIVPNSHAQARFIEEHCPNLTPKVRVITNFVDTDYFSPEAKEKTNTGCLRIVCVGRLFPQKNVLLFLDVVAELKRRGTQLKIDWFGRIDGEYADECLRKMDDLGVSDLIAFRGASQSIRDEYRKADVFCLPSLWEGFPNVVCEAMSCGLPILCSNVCDNANIVEGHKNGFLFNPKSVKDISDKIESFTQMPVEQRMAMGKLNRQKAVEDFAQETFIQKYAGLIEK